MGRNRSSVGLSLGRVLSPCWAALARDTPYSSPELLGIYTAAIGYSHAHGTDGFVPCAVLEPLFTREGVHVSAMLDRFCAERIFRRDVPRGGYHVEDFADENYTAAEIDRATARAQSNGARGGRRRTLQARPFPLGFAPEAKVTSTGLEPLAVTFAPTVSSQVVDSIGVGNEKNRYWFAETASGSASSQLIDKTELMDKPVAVTFASAKSEGRRSTSTRSSTRSSTTEEHDLLGVRTTARKSKFVNPPSADVAALQQMWNEAAKPANLPLWLHTNTERARHAADRLRELPNLDQWREVVQAIVKSSWCRGDNDRGWKADPEFLLRPNTWVRALEGTLERWGEARRQRMSANDRRQHVAQQNKAHVGRGKVWIRDGSDDDE